MPTYKIKKAKGGKWQANMFYVCLGKSKVGFFNNNDFGKIHFRIIKADIMSDNCPNCIWQNLPMKTNANNYEEMIVWLNTNFPRIASTYEFDMENVY